MKRNCMRRLFIAGLAFGSLCSAADTPKPEAKIVDQIVAKVNGDIVSQDEISHAQKELAAQLKQQGASGPQLYQEEQAREKEVLGHRIDELLLTQKGKELNINVDSELSKYMANLQRASGIADT